MLKNHGYAIKIMHIVIWTYLVLYMSMEASHWGMAIGNLKRFLKSFGTNT
jgi:hypothetical protein